MFLRADGFAGGLTPLSKEEGRQSNNSLLLLYLFPVSPVKKFAFDSWETLGKSSSKAKESSQLTSRTVSPARKPAKISLTSESNEKRKRRVRFNEVLLRDMVSVSRTELLL